MCGIHDVTSGVPQKACWGEFSIVIYGNMAYVQMAAAFAYMGIPSCLDTNLEFQHRPFQQWQSELRATFFDTAVELLDERVLRAPNGLWWLVSVY